ncbi:hypothetical protein SAMN05421812_1383 [Asanoa hainanensis]|uniref:Uncharacterized protein n=1 Tax=Asanoa hainanensis TaxID=560556 RepID=A0A239PI71_9ACTN|nr:hypothetical protein [Asanoa hainanensis]SNT66314.1 hypothetical protein SAMN05421812_1383 [Asanoa hainanensis]
MNDVIAAAARTSADQLADRYGPRLAGDVEAAIHATDDRPQQYLDPVSLGSLIVAVAALAWTVYRDLKKKTPQPAPQVVVRSVHLHLTAPTAVPAEDRDLIIETVVIQTLAAAEQAQALPAAEE